MSDFPPIPPLPPVVPALPAHAAPAPQARWCLVCGSALPFRPFQCVVCAAPVGTVINPGDSTFSSYLPISVPMWVAGRLAATRAPRGELGWNWGAAILGPLWAVSHRVRWYVAAWSCWLLALLIAGSCALAGIPAARTILVVCLSTGVLSWLALGIVLGVRGDALAARSGRYADAASCADAQAAWSRWALLTAVVIAVGVIGWLLTVAAGVMSTE